MTSPLPPEHLEILRELDEAFHGNKELVAAYLKRFGFTRVVAPNIRIIRREAEEHQQAQEPSPHEPRSGDDRSPFYLVPVRCLYCAFDFKASMLRTKSLILSYHYKDPRYPLMVAEAKSTTKHFHLEDPLVQSIIVCPNCYYASHSIAHFASDSAMSGQKGILQRLGERKIASLKSSMEEDREARSKLYRESMTFSEHDFWGPARTKEQAIIGYRLAAHCSIFLSEYDPASFYQAAEALISAAKLASDVSDPQEMDFLREAVPFLEQYFEKGQSPSALPIYLKTVIHWHLGEIQETKVWMSRTLAGRNKFPDFAKFKRFLENLKESMHESGATAEATPTE